MSDDEVIGESIGDCLQAADPGPGHVDDAAADCVRAALERDLLGVAPDAVSALVAKASEGVVDGAKRLKAPLWHAARGTLAGAVAAAHALGTDVELVVRASTEALVRRSDEIGGDFRAAAKGSVEGAIRGADRLGLDEERLASVAANAALETARSLREDALAQVRDVVRGPILGIPVRVDGER